MFTSCRLNTPDGDSDQITFLSVSHYSLNTRRACRLIKQTRSVQYYRSVKDPCHDLRGRMHEIARTRVRYGYRRIHVLLKRDGWQLGKNQMYRLYREEQLQLRSKLPKRRKMVVVRQERIRPRTSNDVRSLDFVSDQLANRTRFRALTVVDISAAKRWPSKSVNAWLANMWWRC
jgi:putative transposase